MDITELTLMITILFYFEKLHWIQGIAIVCSHILFEISVLNYAN